MRIHIKSRRSAALALSLALLAAPPAAVARGASSGGVPVKGLTTRWDLTLLSVRDMYQIPHTHWTSYNGNSFRMFVVTVRLANTGTSAAEPLHDLTLTIKVMPPNYTRYPMGFASVLPTDRQLVTLWRTTAGEYGGALPWTATQPGHATTYCYVIATNRGDSHYGLYNFYAPPHHASRYVFLTDLGL